MTPLARLRPTDVLLAPLRWLERSHGWRRRGLALLYFALGAVLGLFAWRAAGLNGLRDVGDPFDVGAFLAEGDVPPARDAFARYRDAAAAYRPATIEDDPSLLDATVRRGWAGAGPEHRAWVVQNRPALAIWREAADRPDASYRAYGLGPGGDVLGRRLSLLAMAADLEASRLATQGDPRGAWGWTRALLRTSDHVRARGGSAARGLAFVLEARARNRLLAIVNATPPEAPLLREALAELARLDDRTPPLSVTYRADYLEVLAALERPEAPFRLGDPRAAEMPSHGGWELFLKNEPERSRRIVRHAFANWLAHCDRPSARRPPLVSHPSDPRWRLYAVDPADPPGARSLPPERLFAWIDSAPLVNSIAQLGPSPGWSFDPAVERRERSGLELKLAERLYEIETGAPPENIDALVPRYLPKSPDWYVPEPAAPPGSGGDRGP